MIIPIDYTSPVAWPASFAAGTASCQCAADLDALRLAILERASVIGITSLNYLYTPDYIPYPGKTLKSSVLVAYHNAIRVLIPYFVNHTKYAPDKTYFVQLEMWTERNIVDYLQDDYQYPQKCDMDNTLWLMQQYRIINVLSYTYVRAQITGYGFVRDDRSASAMVQQAFSTLNYWGGEANWTAGHSETLNQETNPYVTEPMIPDRPERLKAYIENKYTSAEWGVAGYDGIIKSIFESWSQGGWETVTSNKLIQRLWFRFVNNSKLVCPSFNVTINRIESDTIVESSIIAVPDVQPGETFSQLIYTMPELAFAAVNTHNTELREYKYILPFDVVPPYVYALCPNGFKFRGDDW